MYGAGTEERKSEGKGGGEKRRSSWSQLREETLRTPEKMSGKTTTLG